MAKAYPAMQVKGIDVSETMVDYATKRAIAEEIDNVHFQVMDFQHLDVETSSFDFVNARFVQWFLNHQCISALAKAGKTAVPGERFVGTPLLLRPSLQSPGCQDIRETAHLVNFSAGTEEHVFVGDDIIRGRETMNVFVLKSRIVGKKKLAEAQEQVRRDLQSLDFLGLMFFVSTWGRKP